MAKLGELKEVYLSGSRKLDDATMEVIADWEKLEALNIYGCPNITDDGIHIIRGLGKLRFLSIGIPQGRDPGPNQSKITNKSIEDLSNLKELRVIDISRTMIDDAGQ